jgi:glutamate carboxypeptidase
MFLQQLVEMNSQVKNNTGILLVQKLLRIKLGEMKFQTEFVSNKLIDTAPLLLAKRYVRSNVPTVTFVGHSDVVTNPKQNSFRIDKDRIYGSGVADDKGGVVVCIKAVESFLSSVIDPQININIVISPNEETGSIGFHDLFRKLGKESDYVLGLEPALKCGSLISSRSGNRWYQFYVKGIAAHAGRFGHNYINAAHKLSLLVAKMHELNDESSLRRVNVGSFHGGSGGFNTICNEAQAKVDVRFSTFECREYLQQQIEEIIHETSISCPYSAQTSKAFYSIEDDCPPLDGKAFCSSWYAPLINSISNQEGLDIQGIHAGGAADINYFAMPGKRLLDGLGPIGGGLHTAHEYIERKSLETRTLALKEFLRVTSQERRHEH